MRQREGEVIVAWELGKIRSRTSKNWFPLPQRATGDSPADQGRFSDRELHAVFLCFFASSNNKMIFYRKHSRSSLPNLEKIKTMENIFVCLSIEEKWQLLLYDFSIIDEFSVKSLCCEMKGTVSINAIRVSLLLLDETELKLLFFFSILVPDSLLPEPLWFYLCLFQLSLLPVILYLKKTGAPRDVPWKWKLVAKHWHLIRSEERKGWNKILLA